MERKVQIVIISGMSGAGKSRAADILEDLGWYCVDNLPIALLQKFAEFCISAAGRYERVALVTDIRTGDGFAPLFEAMKSLGEMGCECRIVFLDSATDAIIRRYKESRRPHPLAADGETLADTVERERGVLMPIREHASAIIDTTVLNGTLLREKLTESLHLTSGEMMRVRVMSFGFKYGIPAEADLVFDVRFLPNPFYEESLRELTGLDKPVRDFVFSFESTEEFLRRLEPLISFLLPGYVEEGKSSLTIAIGCTGGRHRSTAIAKELCERINGAGTRATVTHRDIDKG